MRRSGAVSHSLAVCLACCVVLCATWQYIKYNTVLRSKTQDPSMLKLVRDMTKGNTYTTTIHAINSCVIKLSKLTKAGKVRTHYSSAITHYSLELSKLTKSRS